MLRSGAVSAVRSIVKTNNLVYVDQVEDGPLVDWVLTSGLTQEEAALIDSDRVNEREDWDLRRNLLRAHDSFEFEPKPSLHVVTKVTVWGDVIFDSINYELEAWVEPEELQAEVAFTGPKSGTITVPSRENMEYVLYRSEALGGEKSYIGRSRDGTGEKLVFEFDESQSGRDAAYFHVEGKLQGLP